MILDRFSSNEIQNVLRIGSEWLGMVRKQITEWLGKAVIRSEWISIRYFYQGFQLICNVDINMEFNLIITVLFGLIRVKKLVRIGPVSFGLMPRNKADQVGLIFDRLSSNEKQSIFRIDSEWFTFPRIQISERIGIVLIISEWIPIQNFRQGFHW